MGFQIQARLAFKIVKIAPEQYKHHSLHFALQKNSPTLTENKVILNLSPLLVRMPNVSLLPVDLSLLVSLLHPSIYSGSQARLGLVCVSSQKTDVHSGLI